MDNCERCYEFIYSDNNVCDCKPFKVYYPEWFGAIEEEIFYGKSFEDVIEKFARDINDCYAVMHGNVFKTAVEITDESGETKLFNCRACAVIDYYSEEIKK